MQNFYPFHQICNVQTINSIRLGSISTLPTFQLPTSPPRVTTTPAESPLKGREEGYEGATNEWIGVGYANRWLCYDCMTSTTVILYRMRILWGIRKQPKWILGWCDLESIFRKVFRLLVKETHHCDIWTNTHWRGYTKLRIQWWVDSVEKLDLVATEVRAIKCTAAMNSRPANGASAEYILAFPLGLLWLPFSNAETKTFMNIW